MDFATPLAKSNVGDVFMTQGENSPQEIASQVRLAHEEHFERFDPALEERWERKRKQYTLEALSVAKGSGNASLLDAGCGPGHVLEAASGMFSELVAVDFSSTILKMVKKHMRTNCVQADATRLPFRDGCFDVALSSEVLQHVTNHEEALRELFRIARHAVVIVIPIFGTLEHLATKLIPGFPKRVHPLRKVTLRMFDAGEFSALVENIAGRGWVLTYIRVPHIIPARLLINEGLRLPKRIEPLATMLENSLNRLLPYSGVKAFLVYERT